MSNDNDDHAEDDEGQDDEESLEQWQARQKANDEKGRWTLRTMRINGMDDLRDVAKGIDAEYPEWRVSAACINTHGAPMPHALTYGDLRDIPFHEYEGPAFGSAMVTSCSIASFRRKLERHHSQVNPNEPLACLHVTPTESDRRVYEGYPLDWAVGSTGCLYLDLLEQEGLILEGPSKNAAPDCLLLCERRTGLALPVPIGATLVWEVLPDFLDIRTFGVVPMRVSDGADYMSEDSDPGPALLAEEAGESERYIVGLLDRSRDTKAPDTADLRRDYADYCAHIAQIRKRHAR